MVNPDFNDRCIIVPSLSMYTDEMYLYGRREWIKEPNYRHKNSLLNLKDNNRKIEISTKSKHKIKRATKLLLYQTTTKKAYNHKTNKIFSFKVNFITLTLSSEQIHTDQEIKSTLLNQFLIEAKKKWKVTYYIWRAEKQNNGNIHFHILTDKYIPWLELRNTWNRIQNKLGYIDRFHTRHNHTNPNSTDIHALWKIKNVASYITKYLTKIEEREQVKGENWRASKELSNIKGAQVDITDNIYEEIERLQNEPGSKRINKEHFSGIFFDRTMVTKQKYPLLYDLFSGYIISVFGYKEQIIFNNS